MALAAVQNGHTKFHALQKYWPLCAIAFVLWLMTVLAHQGWRVVQVFALVVPVLVLLSINVRTAWWPRLQITLAALWGGVFIADAAIRGFLLSTYQALPNSSLVVSALANSNSKEAFEFVHMYWWPLLLWVGAAVLAGCLLIWSLLQWRVLNLAQHPQPKILIIIQLVLLLLLLIALLLKPWRRLHPMVFWPSWFAQVEAFQAQWRGMSGQREQLLRNAQLSQATMSSTAPNTVVLIISDSVNRDNLGLYGYARNTTPKLSQLQAASAGGLQIFSNAWSLDSATIPALQRFFHLGSLDEQPEQHLLALARSAGYRIWWVSNHDDLAIEQQHAGFSHQQHILNAQPGRSARNLDQRLIPVVKQALDDQAPKKLIVVHLLGAHPHYRLRYPSHLNPFPLDDVDDQLRDDDRSARLRQLRREYDTALYYHDQVLAELFQLRQRSSSSQAWLYFSDHGQEVAHSIDHAGHSAQTAAGYRIPVLLWQSDAPQAEPVKQALRSDWLGWSLLNLLNIEWQGYQAERDFLHPSYRWQAPELPIAVDFNT